MSRALPISVRPIGSPRSRKLILFKRSLSTDCSLKTVLTDLSALQSITARRSTAAPLLMMRLLACAVLRCSHTGSGPVLRVPGVRRPAPFSSGQYGPRLRCFAVALLESCLWARCVAGTTKGTLSV